MGGDMNEGLTHEQIVVACKNIGFDVTCGACASLFYTGTAPYAHDNTCTTPEVIDVGPTHPLWSAWDDDDWNGSTATNWVNSYVKGGVRICLRPPSKASKELQHCIRLALEGRGAFVRVAT